MLCHVTRPDSVVMEVEVDAKANGEDCLNKVGCGGIHITFCYCDAFLKHGVAVVHGGSAPVLLRNFKISRFAKLKNDSLLLVCDSYIQVNKTEVFNPASARRRNN